MDKLTERFNNNTMSSCSSTTSISDSSSNNETMPMSRRHKKKIRISNDIWHNVVAFITRAELGQIFSLTNRHFHALAYPKMHAENAHWVDGECHFIAASDADKATMVVPKGSDGGFEVVPVPSVPLQPNVLGFRGKMHFNGVLSDPALAFFGHALPCSTTLYRFSRLEDFYRVNGLLSPFQTTERFNRFLDNCVHLPELGGDDAFVNAFLAHPSVRGRMRKLRATKYGDLYLNWLQQRDGEWRQLQVMHKMTHEERNRLIKLVFQNLNEDVPSSSPDDPTGPSSSSCRYRPTRFCARLTVRNWGDPVERLPLRWLRNARNGQCVVLVERRSADNLNVELCILRCPCTEADQRGLMHSTVTMDNLEAEFGWDEPVCTVDVMNHRSDSDDDPVAAAAAAGAINATPLHQFF